MRQIMCFRQKVETQQQQNKHLNIKPLREPGIGAMGRNVNKQSRICGPHVFNKIKVHFFSVIFLNAWIPIFCSFSYLRE